MSELGNLISEHKENQTATGSTLMVGLICFGLTVAMGFFFTAEKEISFNKVLFGLSSVFALMGGIGSVLSYLKNRGGRVELYENGLLAEKGGKRYTASWDDIESVKESIEKMYVKGAYVYDRYLYTIEKRGGETFDLSNMVSNIDEIGRVLKHKTLEKMYAQSVEKINNGEQILFDQLALDKTGLGGLPWAELARLKIADGVIEVKDRNNKTVINGSYAGTPNAHLLVALVKDHLPVK